MARDKIEKVDFDPETSKKLLSFWSVHQPDNAKFGTGDWVLPADLDVDFIRNDFVVHPDDLWIVTPPKCGTTWTQEIVWLITTDVDLAKSQKNQFYRIPFLELGHLLPKHMKTPLPEFATAEHNEENVVSFMSHSVKYVASLDRPRIIKTHLPFDLLPKNLLDTCKVIYVGRNVKDAAVSWYHHCKLRGFSGSFPDMADTFLKGQQLYSPIFDHILGAWKRRNHPNLYFTMYENMKLDLDTVVKNMAAFMGKQLSEEQHLKILENVDIEAFRRNKYVNKEKEFPPDKDGKGFIRKGVIGDWKNFFDASMNAQWDPWIEKNLHGTGFNMIFEA